MPFRLRARVTLAIAALLLATPAAAHRSTTGGPTSGLSIPSVTHGQMTVLADNRRAIFDLADTQYPTDPEMRRLQAFVALQYFYCGFGLMPGSLSDEASPFNECAHAYLAGTRALLLHLKEMPGDRAAKQALGRKIDVEMLERNAAMVLCQFSDEPFNTADVIIPRISAVLENATCLAVLIGLALLAFLVGCAASIGWPTWRPRVERDFARRERAG